MGIKLHKLPIVGGALKKADLLAKDKGMIEVMRMIVASSGGKLVVKNKTTQLDKVLKNNKVLVICNHPAQADVPILLSNLVPRDDAYIVASHHYLNLLPNVDKQVIPVYITHRENSNGWKFRLLNRLNPVKIHSQNEAHQKNIESINRATQKINDGGLVVIFPATKEKYDHFMAGVGHIIKNLKIPTDVEIVMAYVEGTSAKDYFRLIPYLNKVMPALRLTFSETYPASEVWDNDARISSKNLEKRYLDWIESC
jgi:hypothetical protein